MRPGWTPPCQLACVYLGVLYMAASRNLPVPLVPSCQALYRPGLQSTGVTCSWVGDWDTGGFLEVGVGGPCFSQGSRPV